MASDNKSRDVNDVNLDKAKIEVVVVEGEMHGLQFVREEEFR